MTDESLQLGADFHNDIAASEVDLAQQVHADRGLGTSSSMSAALPADAVADEVAQAPPVARPKMVLPVSKAKAKPKANEPTIPVQSITSSVSDLALRALMCECRAQFSYKTLCLTCFVR